MFCSRNQWCNIVSGADPEYSPPPAALCIIKYMDNNSHLVEPEPEGGIHCPGASLIYPQVAALAIPSDAPTAALFIRFVGVPQPTQLDQYSTCFLKTQLTSCIVVYTF
jgi:hypothetical protein